MIPFRDNVAARRYPVMTVSLIVLNVAVFLYEITLPPARLEALVLSYGTVPAYFAPGAAEGQGLPVAFLPLFTSMFLHGGWLHGMGNMWYLWIFGDNVEDRMGHFSFLVFYLLCGLAGGLAHVVFNLSSTIPSIGASGAVAGELGAYLISYPFARILTIVPLFFFWPIIELPAILVLGSWFLIQFLYGTMALGSTTAEAMGGVAWWAHIGGFLTGILLLRFFASSPSHRRKIF